eukprot:CAMPEP_0202473146 /NCGR_PEP_ID=MMETSP1360-20130828/90036_1 /ASSEMBLY_ACC=CAM_ASM_000848 /TAXON_ID=515479 /ORGANISM="Licmophora paradoxa, Strain CCMP2313" /LENGTH=80 /DNA_ID=CAMNT_0049099927 /DNA_START=359 /DNA_END=601 /DNA_ORIENTATION=+
MASFECRLAILESAFPCGAGVITDTAPTCDRADGVLSCVVKLFCSEGLLPAPTPWYRIFPDGAAPETATAPTCCCCVVVA